MWKNLFSMENPVMQALGVACDLLVLNVLAALCSLPLVTAGPALAALSAVSLAAVRGEENGAARPFFRSFRANLKKGVPLGLLFLLLFFVLAVDYWAAGVWFPAAARLLRLPVLAAGALLLSLALWAFPLLGRYENTLPGTLQNALRMAAGFFPQTLGMLLCTAGLWAACLRFFAQAAPVLLLFGFSLPAYVCALLYDKPFRAIEHEDEDTTP